MKYLIVFLSVFLVFSCDSKSSKDEQMKSIVKEYFNLVKNNEIKETPKLFWEGDTYSGGIQADAFFLNKHYDELKLDELVQQMKIKDTTSIIPSQKQKYIQFTVKKGEDFLPLKITFIFDEMYGFEKIQAPLVLTNQLFWKKSLDSLNKKGLFPNQ